MKRIINGMIAGMTALCVIIGLTGCGVEKRLPEYDSKYFRYAVRTYRDGSQEGYLVGFTELGAAQTELILPQEIDGVPMVGFGYQRNLGMGHEAVGEFYSEKLKRLYAPFVAQDGTWTGQNFYGSMPNAYFIQWKKLFPVGADKCLKGSIIGGKVFESFFDYYSANNSYSRLANISYMYNYEGAEDEGYYWVDSYDNEAVSFIPPAPTREGYSFGGWYKEAECLHAWDFAKDRTGDEIVIESYSKYEDYKDREITYLYAKWNKEN